MQAKIWMNENIQYKLHPKITKSTHKSNCILNLDIFSNFGLFGCLDFIMREFVDILLVYLNVMGYVTSRWLPECYDIKT